MLPQKKVLTQAAAALRSRNTTISTTPKMVALSTPFQHPNRLPKRWVAPDQTSLRTLMASTSLARATVYWRKRCCLKSCPRYMRYMASVARPWATQLHLNELISIRSEGLWILGQWLSAWSVFCQLATCEDSRYRPVPHGYDI